MIPLKNISNHRLAYISFEKIEIRGPAHLFDAAQLWLFDDAEKSGAYYLELNLSSDSTMSSSRPASVAMRLFGPIRGSICVNHSSFLLKTYSPYDSRVCELRALASPQEDFDQESCIIAADRLALKISFVMHEPLYIWNDYQRSSDKLTFSDNEKFSLERLSSLGFYGGSND